MRQTDRRPQQITPETTNNVFHPLRHDVPRSKIERLTHPATATQ